MCVCVCVCVFVCVCNETKPPVSHTQCRISNPKTYQESSVVIQVETIKQKRIWHSRKWRMNVLYYSMHLEIGFHQSLMSFQVHWRQEWRRHTVVQSIQDLFSNGFSSKKIPHLFFWSWAGGVACIFLRLILCLLLRSLLFSPNLRAVFSPCL